MVSVVLEHSCSMWFISASVAVGQPQISCEALYAAQLSVISYAVFCHCREMNLVHVRQYFSAGVGTDWSYRATFSWQLLPKWGGFKYNLDLYVVTESTPHIQHSNLDIKPEGKKLCIHIDLNNINDRIENFFTKVSISLSLLQGKVFIFLEHVVSLFLEGAVDGKGLQNIISMFSYAVQAPNIL